MKSNFERQLTRLIKMNNESLVIYGAMCKDKLIKRIIIQILIDRGVELV